MSERQHDRVYSNVLLIDGTGARPRLSDVGINGDKIVAVAEAGTLTGRVTVAGEGKALAPGFIDIHSHADMPILVDGRAHSLVTQGITTIVPGNCGGGASPTVKGATIRQSRAEWLTDIGDFSTFPAYMDRVGERGAGVNVLPLVPHGMLRGLVAGMDTRELTPREIAQVSDLVAEAMDAGAVGLSSGLEYAPGIAATTAELAAIAVPVGERGGFYATHCRNRSDRIVEAAEEAVYIAESSGSRLQMSHFLRRPTGPGRELEQRAWQIIRAADNRGVRSRFDVFPFEYGPSPLTMFVPQKFRAEAGPHFAQQLQDAAFVERILGDLDPRFLAMLEQGIAADMYISDDGNTGEYVGLTLGQVSERWRMPVPDTALRLMAEAGDHFADVVINERWADFTDLVEAMEQPDFILMGDGSMANLDGPLQGRGFALSDWGYATAALGTFARRLGKISLEEAVRRLTSAPAEQIGLTGRGRVEPGYFADVVLFDPATVGSGVTPDNISVVSTGVEEVLVNGEPVVASGTVTNAKPGRIGLTAVNG